jgi:hypothetical protein
MVGVEVRGGSKKELGLKNTLVCINLHTNIFFIHTNVFFNSSFFLADKSPRAYAKIL